MKKAIPFFLALALALSLGLSAFAEELLLTAPYEGEAAPDGEVLVVTPEGEEPEFPAVTAIPPIALYGTIVEEYENGSLLVQSDWNENDRVILNLSEDTFVVDAVTGLTASLSERETDRVAVFYGPVTTRSLPPQSNAVAIAVNLPEDSFSPHYAKVEQIVRNEDSVRILTDGGSLYITIDRETPIAPYRTRNIVSVDNLRVGSELMVWYDIVALSYPGQTAANRVVILQDGPAGDTVTVSVADGTAGINGSDEMPLTVRETEDGTVLLPLRLICEELGFTVNWLPETNSVEIVRGETVIALTFDSPALNIDGKLVVLSHAPEVDNWVTYVPADFFQLALAVDLFLV